VIGLRAAHLRSALTVGGASHPSSASSPTIWGWGYVRAAAPPSCDGLRAKVHARLDVRGACRAAMWASVSAIRVRAQ